MRKMTILGSDQVRHKPACSITDNCSSKFGVKKKRDCTIRVAKTMALISCAVTAQLICAFVFAYVDCCSSSHSRIALERLEKKLLEGSLTHEAMNNVCSFKSNNKTGICISRVLNSQPLDY